MTGTRTGPYLAALLPRNWSLPVKLAAVLAVPIMLAVTLGALRIADQIDDATDLRNQQRNLTTRDQVAALVVELQRERYQAAILVAGRRPTDRVFPRRAPISAAVDRTLTETRNAIGDAAALGDEARAAYQPAGEELSGLSALRERVAGAPGSDLPVVIARYTELIDSLLTFVAALDHGLDTPHMGGLPAGMTTLATVREQITLQHVVIAAAITRGELSPLDADTLRAGDAHLAAAVSQLRIGAARGHRQLLSWTDSEAVQQRQHLKQAVLGRVAVRGPLGIDRATWDAVNGNVLTALRDTAAATRAEIGSLSLARQERARDAAGADSVILLLGLLTTAAVVYLVCRSMLKPLRVLRRTALDVANHRLPDAVRGMREGRTPDVAVRPVAVSSTEEIGQVARAFDAVHGQAIRLAAEQATLQSNVSGMFVNLSRRSQSLVERQLRLIEQLERNEQDSEQLAHLFQLDHLATRMRRNSDNLLVLAGSELTQRVNKVIPVVDVLRAATSEIENYQRVVVRTPPDARILGHAANDLVHLVAELLDNATSFSAPDTQVTVDSTRNTDGSVMFEIADEGVGMPTDELAAANRRLSGTVEMDVSTSRRMGLFVVGRLAARHRIGVRLAITDQSRGTRAGITAYVHVLSHLVAAPEPGQPTAKGPEVGGSPASRIGEPTRKPKAVLPPVQTKSGLASRTKVPAVRRPEPLPKSRPEPPPERPDRTTAAPTGTRSSHRPRSPRTAEGPRQPRQSPPDRRDPLSDSPTPDPIGRSAGSAAALPPSPDETPIYTRMESAWFRSGGRELPDLGPSSAESPRHVAGRTGDEPAAPERQWQNWDPADPLRPMPEPPPSALTGSGLPKRKPRSQLIPRGTEDVLTSAERREAPARRPERVRGLLASYQEGLRQGRAGSGGARWAAPVHVPPHTRGAQG